MNVVGFICEFDENIVKIFEFKKKQLVTRPNTSQIDLYKSHVYSVAPNGKFKEMTRKELRPELDLTQDNQVNVYTWAVRPGDDLPVEIREKYDGKVWSPHLDLISDPKNLFAKYFQGGQKVKVTVKYAPNENTVFEIVHVHQLEVDGVSKNIPPWDEEAGIENPNKKTIHPSEMVRITHQPVNHAKVPFALCIGINRKNPLSQFAPSHSRCEECNELFGMKYGLVRWLVREKSGEEMLGKWFSHQFNDNRAKDKMIHNNMTTYTNGRARNVVEIAPPLPTRVIGGQIELDTSFTFEHKMLENAENRMIKDWAKRIGGLSKNAHFWNQYLGKVEIYPKISKEILEAIENHQKIFGYKNPNKPNPDKFVIFGTVTPFNNYYRNSKNYPENGIFFLKSILRIEKNGVAI